MKKNTISPTGFGLRLILITPLWLLMYALATATNGLLVVYNFLDDHLPDAYK